MADDRTAIEEKRRYHREYFRRRYRDDPEFRERAKRQSSASVKRCRSHKPPGYSAEKARKQRQTDAYKVWRKAYEKTERYRKRIRAYSAKRRADPALQPILKAYYNKHREKARLRNLVRGAVIRCKKSGMKYDEAFLLDLVKTRPIICPCCSVTLDYSVGRPRELRPSTPSLDRVDCTKGYVVDNVAVICWRCNMLKRDALLSELENIVEYMRERLQCGNGQSQS